MVDWYRDGIEIVMKKYLIEVTQVVMQTRFVEVRAESEDEALAAVEENRDDLEGEWDVVGVAG